MKKIIVTSVAILGFAFTTMAQILPSYIPANGLVGYWGFNGNANDASGNGNNGAVTGATLTTDRFGVSNKAYSFNGSSNYIDVNDTLPLRLNNTDYTISVWVYFNSLTGPDIISKRGAGSQNGYDFTSSTSHFVMHQSGGSSDPIVNSNYTLVNSSWVHVVLVYNNGTSVFKFYVNGVLDATANSFPTPNSNTSSKMRFGGDVLLSTYWLNGKLDDIGIWRRALTTSEISTLYNGCNLSPVTISAGGATTFCQGNNVSLNSSKTGSGYTYTWQLNSVSISGANNSSYSAIQPGSYSLKVDSGGCSVYSNSINVSVNPLPTVSFSINSYTNIQTNSLVISGSPSGGSFSGSGVLGNNFYPSSAGLGLKNITYSYTDGNGCSNSVNSSTLVYDTLKCFVSVTDTLIIKAVLTGIAPPNNLNSIKIYPNPTKDHIYIDNGDITKMIGYQVKITTSTGQQIFLSAITQQQFYIDLSSLIGKGLYFVQIINPQGNVVDVRKIVLQ